MRRWLSVDISSRLALGTVLPLFPGVAMAQTVSIVVIGASDVAGRGLSADEAYPAQLEAALRAKGLNVSVSNQGVSGEVSAATASRAGWIGSGTDIVVYWNNCHNDRRQGGSLEACRANNAGASQALQSKGIAVYPIRPPVWEQSMHRDPRLTLGGQGRMMDFRDGRGPVPDGHLNAAGYRLIVQRSLAPISRLVIEAQKRKGKAA